MAHLIEKSFMNAEEQIRCVPCLHVGLGPTVSELCMLYSVYRLYSGFILYLKYSIAFNVCIHEPLQNI